MILIALKDGHEVAKIHGPIRNEYILEYRNPESGHDTKVSKNNLHVLRGIAERTFPGMVWKE
jgi:hypothetical protein